MKLLTVAARLVLTGAVATTLAVAQAPQAYAHCGNPDAHAAIRGLRDLALDPRFASPAARAKIQDLQAQLQLLVQRWITAVKQESGLFSATADHRMSRGIQTEIHAILDQIQHARAQHSFG